jgi:lysophospholipase L1-like esterase
VGSRIRGTVREAAIGVVILGVSVAVLFVVGEGLCRLFFPDTQLRYVSDPEALFRLAPRQHASIVLGSGLPAPTARINELGVRGASVDTSRPTILVVGDSFTFGSGVADDETFSARLGQWFGPDTTVVNGGQPGYGVSQMATTLRRLGDVLRPRLVIVVIWQGDFLRQPLDASERARFIRRQQFSQIAKTSVLVTHLYRRVERLMLSTGQGSLVFRVGEGDWDSKSGAEAVLKAHLTGMRADASRLLAMHEEARRYGKGLLLVLWPKEDFAHLPEAEQELAQHLTSELDAFGREHGIPFISVQPAMQRVASKAKLLIPDDWHPTPLAHCLAAERIAEKLQELGFLLTPIDCNVVVHAR